MAALNVDCRFDMLSYLTWNYVRKAWCLWLVSRIGLVWRIGSSYSKLKNWWGVKSTKIIQNRSLDKKTVDHCFIRSVTVQRLRHSSKGFTWSNLESAMAIGIFRPGYSHRMILVRWEAERCFPGSNLVAESHGKDGGWGCGTSEIKSWCDVMICNASGGLQVGKHHFFFYISGSSITHFHFEVTWVGCQLLSFKDTSFGIADIHELLKLTSIALLGVCQTWS